VDSDDSMLRDRGRRFVRFHSLSARHPPVALSLSRLRPGETPDRHASGFLSCAYRAASSYPHEMPMLSNVGRLDESTSHRLLLLTRQMIWFVVRRMNSDAPRVIAPSSRGLPVLLRQPKFFAHVAEKRVVAVARGKSIVRRDGGSVYGHLAQHC
jgi:hypothetical protein